MNWFANNDFYVLRSGGESESLFEALRDYKPAGPMFKGEIGRWLGFTFVEDDELRFERIDPSDLYE